MPKKKNAFWNFFQEFKREHKIDNQQDAMQRADAVWRTMNERERKKYAPGKNIIKLGSAPLRELEIKQNDEIIFQQTMLEEISSEVAMAKKYNNLSNCRFFLIHINSLCQHADTKKHYPCEIGISSFTLSDGVSKNDVYHAMVYPGPLPTGYTATARNVSEQTHQIPWEYDDLDNTDKIFEEVVNFLLQRSGASTKVPIVYTKKEDMEMVKSVLDVWCDYYDPNINFTVYSIQTLFSVLYKNIITDKTWSPESFAFIEIQKDVHGFTPGIGCEYHESADATVYCSCSVVVRTVYTICEALCPSLDIDCIPGQHIPLKKKGQMSEERPSTWSKNNQVRQFQDESTSSVRLDGGDEETMSSFGRSGVCGEEATSSINFPDYDNFSVTSEATTISNRFSNHMSGGSNLTNNYPSKTGSAGFSRRPAALPSSVNENLGRLTLEENSQGTSPEKSWQTVQGRRGRGGRPAARGAGRGRPFR